MKTVNEQKGNRSVKPKKSTKTRYPWVDWIAKGKVKLVKDKDYFGRNDTFVQQVRQRGTRWGYKIRIEMAKDEKSMVLTFEERDRKTCQSSRVG